MCQCMEQEEHRRSSSMVPDSIRVHVTVRVGTKTSADVMAIKLTSDEINDELAKEGLRAATIVEKAVVSEPLKTSHLMKWMTRSKMCCLGRLCPRIIAKKLFAGNHVQFCTVARVSTSGSV